MFVLLNTKYINLKIGIEAIYINIIFESKIKEEYYINISNEDLKDLFIILSKYNNYKVNIFIDNADVNIINEQLLPIYSLSSNNEIKNYVHNKFLNKELFSYTLTKNNIRNEIAIISSNFSSIIEMVLTQCDMAKVTIQALYFPVAEIFNLLAYLQKNSLFVLEINEPVIFAFFSRTNGLQIISTHNGLLYENSSFPITKDNSTQYLHGFLEYTINSSNIKIAKALNYSSAGAKIIICVPKSLYDSLNNDKNFTNNPQIKIIENIKLVRYHDVTTARHKEIYSDGILLNFSPKIHTIFQEDFQSLQSKTIKLAFLQMFNKILLLFLLIILCYFGFVNYNLYNLTDKLQEENFNILAQYSEKKEKLKQKYPNINIESHLIENLIREDLPNVEEILDILNKYLNKDNISILTFSWGNKIEDKFFKKNNIDALILLKHNYLNKDFSDDKNLHQYLNNYYNSLSEEFNKLGYETSFSINYDGIIKSHNSIITLGEINLIYKNK